VLIVTELLFPLSAMPLVTGIQRTGGVRLDVWFRTNPPALVDQETIIFGGLAATLSDGGVALSVLTVKTPAASACEPLDDGAIVTIKPFAVLVRLIV
jgi:hypothetical protein